MLAGHVDDVLRVLPKVGMHEVRMGRRPGGHWLTLVHIDRPLNLEPAPQAVEPRTLVIHPCRGAVAAEDAGTARSTESPEEEEQVRLTNTPVLEMGLSLVDLTEHRSPFDWTISRFEVGIEVCGGAPQGQFLMKRVAHPCVLQFSGAQFAHQSGHADVGF